MIPASKIPENFSLVDNASFAKNLVRTFNLPFEYLDRVFYVLFSGDEVYHLFALNKKGDEGELVIYEGESMVYNSEDILTECIGDILENY